MHNVIPQLSQVSDIQPSSLGSYNSSDAQFSFYPHHIFGQRTFEHIPGTVAILPRPECSTGNFAIRNTRATAYRHACVLTQIFRLADIHLYRSLCSQTDLTARKQT